MKVRIEIDSEQEEEIIIKCKSIDEKISNIQKYIESENADTNKTIILTGNVSLSGVEIIYV